MTARLPEAAEPGADRAAVELLAPALGRALAGLRYGTVELTVHDGRVVQIERREKLRIEIDRSAGDPTPSAMPEPHRRRRPDDRSASDLLVGETK